MRVADLQPLVHALGAGVKLQRQSMGKSGNNLRCRCELTRRRWATARRLGGAGDAGRRGRVLSSLSLAAAAATAETASGSAAASTSSSRRIGEGRGELDVSQLVNCRRRCSGIKRGLGLINAEQKTNQPTHLLNRRGRFGRRGVAKRLQGDGRGAILVKNRTRPTKPMPSGQPG